MGFTDITEQSGGSFSLEFVAPPPLGQIFFDEHHQGFTEGHSGMGWSFYGSLLACPRRHYFAQVAKIEPTHEPGGNVQEAHSSLPKVHFGRDVGWTMHAMKEVYYNGGADGQHEPMSKPAVIEALERCSRLQQYDMLHDVASAAEQLFMLWIERWQEEDRRRFTVASVEQRFEYNAPRDDDDFSYSARFDTILKDKASGAMVIFEHKHMRAYRQDVIAGYHLDPQMMGLVYLFKRNRKLRQYALSHLVVDVSVHKKDPQFERFPVRFEDKVLRNFIRQMRLWWKLRGMFDSLHWPQNWAACRSKAPGYFGLCDYFSLCERGVLVSEVGTSGKVPMDFVRKSDLVRKRKSNGGAE